MLVHQSNRAAGRRGVILLVVDLLRGLELAYGERAQVASTVRLSAAFVGAEEVPHARRKAAVPEEDRMPRRALR